MSSDQPAYGSERILLIPLRSRRHRLERQVFTDRGQTHFYDEDAKDFVSWRGEYVRVEVLGHFDSREAAREFMVERSEVSS